MSRAELQGPKTLNPDVGRNPKEAFFFILEKGCCFLRACFMSSQHLRMPQNSGFLLGGPSNKNPVS